MSDSIISDITQALNLAIFRRTKREQFQLVGRAPGWVSVLWPRLSIAAEAPLAELSPFVGHFLVDAANCWKSAGGTERVDSGPWIESDADGHEHYLQATALSAAGRAILLIEEVGPAGERTSILQPAHKAGLGDEKSHETDETLAEQKRLLEQRVRERTATLFQAKAALHAEVSARRRYAEQLQSLRELDRAILETQSPAAIAEAAVRRLHPLLPCEHASVVALDAESGRATVLASCSEGTINREGWQLTGKQLEEAQVLQSGESHRVTAASNHFGGFTNSAAAETVWPLIVDIPLIAADTLVGVLNLATRSPEKFTREHEEVAEAVATQLGVAIAQARLFAEISRGRQQLRALSLRLVEVQEAERRFMAHELHDEIGQLLTGLKLTLELPREEAAGSANANTGEAIALVDELMNRVRQLSLDLRPQILDDLGLLPALDWLFKRYHKQTGVCIRFRHTSLNRRFPARLETAAFRIVQEALTNIARHAHVADATVRLWMNEKNLGLQIEDHGVGFDAEHALAEHSSSGVTGMRERAVMLGGEFTLESKPGEGTRLTVELPFPGCAAAAKDEGDGP